MKRRRIFMFGLTIFIFMAVYLYYTMQNLLKIQLESKKNSSDFKKIYVYLAHREEEEIKDVKQKNLEKQNLLIKNQKNWRESIHLSVVVCGDRANETFILLKSAFIFSKSFIIVHIFAEEELHIHLNKQLDEWLQHVKGKFDYYLYGISHSKLENFTDWKKMFKPCAIQSLFLPTLLPSVDSLLYVDTDTIFLSPLEEIWSHFKQFNSSQLAAMAPDNEEKEKSWYSEFSRHPYLGRFGVNSGVRLMNLTRMRNTTWTESMVDFYREYKPKIWWGDQDLINIYFHFHPDIYRFDKPVLNEEYVVDRRVVKEGCSTGITFGAVVQKHYTFKYNFKDDSGRFVTFENLYQIKRARDNPSTFFDLGDSGSIVFLADAELRTLRPLGLAFAITTAKYTVASPILKVTEALNVDCNLAVNIDCDDHK